MSDMLCCEFDVAPSTQTPAYWWTLLFEGARHAGFTYWHPHLPEGTGLTYSVEFAEGVRRMDFRQMWTHIWRTTQPVTVALYASAADPIEVIVSVQMPSTEGPTTLAFDLPIESLEFEQEPATNARVNATRLHHYLAGVRAIYDLCRPCSVRLVWQKSEWEVGAINRAWMPPVVPTHGTPDADAPPGMVAHILLPDGSILEMLDPFPIPRYFEHIWLSVLSEQTMSR